MRVVIAEDQVLLRDGIRRLVESAGHQVVGEAGEARRLIAEVNETRPDLLVSDLRMPPDVGNEGARAVLYLRGAFPQLPIVVLSQYVEPELLDQVLSGNATAFGYLLKDRVLDTDEFLEQLEQVAAGGTVIDPTIVSQRLSTERDRLPTLTDREIEVLREIATGRSNGAIAAGLFISPRTVDAHIHAIFQKLDLHEDPDGNQRVRATLRWLGIAG